MILPALMFQQVPATISILPDHSRTMFKVFIRNESKGSIRVNRPRAWDMYAQWTCLKRFSKRNETVLILEYPDFVYERSATVIQPKETQFFTCVPVITGLNSGRYFVHLQYQDDDLSEFQNKVKLTQCAGISRDFQFSATIRRGKLSKIKLLKIGPSRPTETGTKHMDFPPLPPVKISQR
jgi:hypothetical protein